MQAFTTFHDEFRDRRFRGDRLEQLQAHAVRGTNAIERGLDTLQRYLIRVLASPAEYGIIIIVMIGQGTHGDADVMDVPRLDHV